MYACMHEWMGVCMHACMRVYVCTCVHVRVYVHYKYMHQRLFTLICMNGDVYVYVYAYVYV